MSISRLLAAVARPAAHRQTPHDLLAKTGLPLCAALVCGCTVITTTEEFQCEVDADCEARGGEFAGSICVENVCQAKPVDPIWGCIGNVEPPVSGNMDTLKSTFLDLITNKPPANATFKLCNKYDAPCDAPLGTPTMEADGSVTVTIPSELEAYLQMEGPGYYPMLAFLDHDVQAENPVVYAVPDAIVGTLATNAGVEIDETKGIVLGRLANCTGAPASGASVAIFPSDQETRFYTINNTVKADATKTDSSGNSGFVNVTPGAPQLTGYVSPGGQAYGTVSTLVRAGHITAQIVKPTPEL
ncbi:MAG: hypothetical protein IPK82_05870 [Polyangiaceae bacterium]|nr:hypothetical protein [Polyangiaceae bacterium]